MRKDTIQRAKTRLTAHVKKGKPSACWPWIPKFRSNYPSFAISEDGEVQNRSVHKVVYLLFKGRVPRNKVVRHSCGNKICCNPRHLRVGTQAENIRDNYRLHKIPRGSAVGTSKLTERVVKSIIRRYFILKDRPTDIARDNEITYGHVLRIVNGGQWSHLKRPPGRRLSKSASHVARGSSLGSRNANSKLDEEKIIEIRKTLSTWDASIAERLARKFGVRPGTIEQVYRRVSWKHVD